MNGTVNFHYKFEYFCITFSYFLANCKSVGLQKLRNKSCKCLVFGKTALRSENSTNSSPHAAY